MPRKEGRIFAFLVLIIFTLQTVGIPQTTKTSDKYMLQVPSFFSSSDNALRVFFRGIIAEYPDISQLAFHGRERINGIDIDVNFGSKVSRPDGSIEIPQCSSGGRYFKVIIYPYKEFTVTEVKKDLKDVKVPTILESAEHMIDKACQVMGMHDDLKDIITSPQNVLTVNFNVKLDSGKETTIWAFRALQNDARGVGKGGLRWLVGRGETLDEAKQTAVGLATLMTVKNGVINVPYGGAKGDLFVEDLEYTDNDKARILRGFARELTLKSAVGAFIDVPAPDKGTDDRMMSWFMDEHIKTLAEGGNFYDKGLQTLVLSRVKLSLDPQDTPFLDAYVAITNEDTNCVYQGLELGGITGKTVGKGGSRGRTKATGYGGYLSFISMMKYFNDIDSIEHDHIGRYLDPDVRDVLKKNVSDMTVSIQGTGNVGEYNAKSFFKAGAKIQMLQDAVYENGEYVVYTLYDKKGIDMDKLDDHLPHGADGRYEPLKTLQPAFFKANPGAKIIRGDKKLFWNEYTDIKVAAATENQITEFNAGEVNCSILLELANNPTSPKADTILRNQKGILIIPDVLANVGGVTVSYFEWLQNIEGRYWYELTVDKMLEHRISTETLNVIRIAKRYDVDLRLAAFILSMARLADAEIARNDSLAAKFSTLLPYKGYGDLGLYPDTIEELDMIDKKGDYQSLVERSEEGHDTQLAQAISGIEDNMKDNEMMFVLVGGPMTSGKLALSNRISDNLAGTGRRVVNIDIDLQFQRYEGFLRGIKVNEGLIVHKRLALIENMINKIKNQIPVRIKSLENGDISTNRYTSGVDDIIVLQGELVLNRTFIGDPDSLLADCPEYSIFVNTAPSMKLSGNWPLTSLDLRFMRHILTYTRMFNFDPIDVIKHWPLQRENNIRNAYPDWNRADMTFNSYLPYELPVLKPYLEPILDATLESAVQSNDLQSITAISRLKRVLLNVPNIHAEIPKRSIIWQFISDTNGKRRAKYNAMDPSRSYVVIKFPKIRDKLNDEEKEILSENERKIMIVGPSTYADGPTVLASDRSYDKAEIRRLSSIMADATIKSIDAFKRIFPERTPKVAFLSFVSFKGEKKLDVYTFMINEAYNAVKKARPEAVLIGDGAVQFDTAFIPSVFAKKTGKAPIEIPPNILVCPSYYTRRILVDMVNGLSDIIDVKVNSARELPVKKSYDNPPLIILPDTISVKDGRPQKDVINAGIDAYRQKTARIILTTEDPEVISAYLKSKGAFFKVISCDGLEGKTKKDRLLHLRSIVRKDTEVSGIIVLDTRNASNVVKAVADTELVIRDKEENEGAESFEQVLCRTLNVSTRLLKAEIADGLVGGAELHSKYFVRSLAWSLLKTTSTLNDYFIMKLPDVSYGVDGCVLYVGTAYREDPNADDLVQMALSGAKKFESTFRGEKARIALINGIDVMPPKAKKAYEKLKNEHPEFDVHLTKFDRALDKKCNVFVFPDLATGNIVYKATERLFGAVATGPFSIDTLRPTSDLSRGATREAIFNTIQVIASQADAERQNKVVNEDMPESQRSGRAVNANKQNEPDELFISLLKMREHMSRIRFAESQHAKDLLAANGANALLIEDGTILVSKDIMGNSMELFRAIIHEEIEAVMQIIKEIDPVKYEGISMQVWRNQPILNIYSRGIVPLGQIKRDELVNDIIAKSFELMVPIELGLLQYGDLSEKEQKIYNAVKDMINSSRHNYFTGIFWDADRRSDIIRGAHIDGKRFYSATSKKHDNHFAERTAIAIRSLSHGPASDVMTYLSAISWNLPGMESRINDMLPDNVLDDNGRSLKSAIIQASPKLQRDMAGFIEHYRGFYAAVRAKSSGNVFDESDAERWLVDLDAIVSEFNAIKEGLVKYDRDVNALCVSQRTHLELLWENEYELLENNLANIRMGIKEFEKIMVSRKRFALIGASSDDEVDIIPILSEWGKKIKSITVKNEAGDSIFVNGDEISIANAIGNIIENANQATTRNVPVESHISISVRNSDASVLVEIADNGGGIDPQLLRTDPKTGLPKICNLNFTTTSANGGSGLGLAETWYVLLDLGWQIKVDPNVNGGAVFTVKIPRKGEKGPSIEPGLSIENHRSPDLNAQGEIDKEISRIDDDLVHKKISAYQAAERLIYKVIPKWAFSNEVVKNQDTLIDIIDISPMPGFERLVMDIIKKHELDADQEALRLELKEYSYELFALKAFNVNYMWLKKLKKLFAQLLSSDLSDISRTATLINMIDSHFDNREGLATEERIRWENLFREIRELPYSERNEEFPFFYYMTQTFVNQMVILQSRFEILKEKSNTDMPFDDNMRSLEKRMHLYEDQLKIFGALLGKGELLNPDLYNRGDEFDINRADPDNKMMSLSVDDVAMHLAGDYLSGELHDRTPHILADIAVEASKIEDQGESIILYADDILKSTVMIDFEKSVFDKLKAQNVFKNGKIILISKDNEKALFLKKVILEQFNEADVLIVSKDMLGKQKSLDRIDDIVKYLKAREGIKDFLGVIRGVKALSDEFAETVEHLKMPTVLLTDEKGIYSFKYALLSLLEMKNNAGSSGWYRMLSPIRTVDEAVQAQYEQYMMALESQIRA